MQTPVSARSRKAKGFTLIELLVVIAVIALLAALIFPVTGAVNKLKIRSKTRTEMEQIVTAVEAYKAKLGHYPPADTNNPAVNPLYYELRGTEYKEPKKGTFAYVTLDGAAQIGPTTVPAFFGSGVGGFVNATRGGGDETAPAINFFRGLKNSQFLTVTNNNQTGVVLGTAVDGPVLLQNADPLKGKINPWRYRSAAPVYNQESFDLWIDVKIGSKIFRFSNWSKEPLIVTAPFSYP